MTLLQLILNGVINASIFSILAVGFGIVYRSLRFFYITFGAIYIIAPYMVVAGMNVIGLPMPVSILIGLIIGILIGVLMERAVFLPLERAGATAAVLFVASLALYIIIVNLIALTFGNEIKILSKGLEPTYSIGALILTRIQVIQFFTGGLIVTAFWFIIRNNTLMKGIWAMGETPNLVLALGLPYESMRMILFALSSAFASAASLLVTLELGIDPHVGMRALLTGAVAVFVGGVEVFWGWIGGAVILALLQSFVVWQFSANWNDLITFGILIVTLLFRPQGLFSPKKRREER